MVHPVVRLRLDFSKPCSVGIDHTGSLTQAARDLGISYRRGWLLLASLNTSFRDPVVVTAIGGRGGGGSRLTRFGEELISRYREFEQETQERAVGAFEPIAQKARRALRPTKSMPVIPKPLNRATAKSARGRK